MALTVALDAAKTNRVRLEGDGKDSDTSGGLFYTRFFGSLDNPDLPFAALAQIDPGGVSSAHFHIVDQFQVVVDGRGKLGRHDLTPYGVHFSRAYTPYGPLVSDTDAGLTFFVLRGHPDPGSQRLPAKREQLQRVPDRQPWQITRQVTFPALPSDKAATDAVLQAVPGIRDEQGLAAYTLRMQPNAKTHTPDPARGDGQYLVVVKGSLLRDDREHQAPALVFIKPKEGPLQIHAGPQGLEGLVLNLPLPQTRDTGAATNAHVQTDFKAWQCMLCAFVYDEAAGLPEEGIPASTRWQDVPATWSCPDCGASRADFQMKGLEN